MKNLMIYRAISVNITKRRREKIVTRRKPRVATQGKNVKTGSLGNQRKNQ
jgi:hypothetical protein